MRYFGEFRRTIYFFLHPYPEIFGKIRNNILGVDMGKSLPKSHFAKEIGIHIQSLRDAIERGDVEVDDIGWIPLDSEKNVRYMSLTKTNKAYTLRGLSEERRKARNVKRKEMKSPIPSGFVAIPDPDCNEEEVKPKYSAEPPPKPRPNIKPKTSSNRPKTYEMKPKKRANAYIPQPKPKPAPKIEPDVDPFDTEYEPKTIIEKLEIEKIRAQTNKLNVSTAKELNTLVLRSFVEEVMKRLATVIASYLLSMGDRLASEIAAVCAIEDIETRLKLKQMIDDDVERSLKAVKSTIRSNWTDALGKTNVF